LEDFIVDAQYCFYVKASLSGGLYSGSNKTCLQTKMQRPPEWINADSLAYSMNALGLPGLIFRPVHYKPYYSVSQGKMVHGVQIHLIDAKVATLTLIQFYLLQETYKLWPGKDLFALCEKSRLDMFDKVCGTDKIRKEFTKDYRVDSILDLWNGSVPAFRKKIQPYLLY
jgi:uncharacterized protein YbbC (DUF1343 family)